MDNSKDLDTNFENMEAHSSAESLPPFSRSFDVRRDSSSSNDSQGYKKLASLNEIEDLYSALQELVNNNVSKNPSNSKTQNIEDIPDMNSSQHRRENSIREKGQRKLVDTKNHDIECNMKSHISRARSNSYTTLLIGSSKKTLDNKSLLRTVSTSSQRLEHSNVYVTDNNIKSSARKIGRSVSVGGRLFRMKDESNIVSHEKKKWKNKLLSRIRSKNLSKKHEIVETIAGKTSNEKELKYLNENRSYGFENKGIKEEIIYDLNNIDHLVESLHLEKPQPSSSKKKLNKNYTETELSKLESWFERAAAQVMITTSTTSSDYDNDSDIRTPPTSRDSRRRTINRNKKAALKRNKSIHDPVKRERRMRQVLPNEDYVSNNVNSFVRLSHAKSTPDLRSVANLDSDDFNDTSTSLQDSCDSDVSFDSDRPQEKEYRHKRSIKDTIEHLLSIRNNLASPKSNNSIDQKVDRKISLQKTPLFYSPDTFDLDFEEEYNILDSERRHGSISLNRPSSLPLSLLYNNTYSSLDEVYSEIEENKVSDGVLCNDGTSTLIVRN